MYWGILSLNIVVYIGRSLQQNADTTECCPCPKSPSRGKSTGDRVLDFVSKSGKFVGDVLGDDSDGSSSFLSPKEVYPTRASVSEPDAKEGLKPFLHPEIDLASSVLHTLRDATEDEYKDALQRDAARNAASSRNSLDSDNINVEEPSTRNIVTIDFDAPDINVMTDADAEESNVQETISDPPQLNTDSNAGMLNKIINPIKENLERAKETLNRDTSVVHDNIKERLDKIFKLESRIQKPSPKMQHLRLSELFHRDPLNKVSDKNQQTKSNIDENDGMVINNASENTNFDVQDSDTAASTVTESIMTSEPVNTEKIEKLAYKPKTYSKLGPLKLGESSKDVLYRLKDSNQRISNKLKNALKSKHEQDDESENNDSLPVVGEQSMGQNDFKEEIKDMSLEAIINQNNIACPTEQNYNDEQEIDIHQTKSQVNDNAQPAESFINENMNDDFSVMTNESFIDPNISTDSLNIEPTDNSNPSNVQQFNNIDYDDVDNNDGENQFQNINDDNQNTKFNNNSQPTDVTSLHLEPEDIQVEDEMDPEPDSISEENNFTNNAVHFNGNESPNINTIDSNKDSDLNNANETSDTNIQEEPSNNADKDFQKISDKLLHIGLKNEKKEINKDGCLVETDDNKQLNQNSLSKGKNINNQNKDVISPNIRENTINKSDMPSNIDMVPEASELSSKYALPMFSKPLEGFKSRSPVTKSSIVQPESLLPSLKNFNSLTQQLNLPSFDELRTRLSNILNINEDGVSTLFSNFNSPQMKSASSFPVAKLDLPTLSDIHNNIFSNSKLQPSNGFNFNVFKLRPSPFNGINFNSIRTKLPLQASSPLQPLKLLSTVKDRDGVFGASLALNNANKRNSLISRNTIVTKKDIKPHFVLENTMKRKVNSISTPTHVKINKENILRSNEPDVDYSGRSPPNVPSETKRIITTFQKSNQGLQQLPLKPKQQLNSKALQRQTIQEPISNLKSPNNNSAKPNTNLKDAVIQALTNGHNKDLSYDDRQNEKYKSTKTNFNLKSKPVMSSMKATTSTNDIKLSSNIRDKITNSLKNNNDKMSYDSSPLASSPLKNIEIVKKAPIKPIFENTVSKKLKEIKSNKKQTGALGSKTFSKASENFNNGQVLQKTLTYKKDATIPTVSKVNIPSFKQVDHPWGLLRKDLLKNNVPDRKQSSRLWNYSKIPKLKIPLLKNSLLTKPKPFEKISTVEIINPFSKDLFGSADTQTPSIVSVSPSSKLLNSKSQTEKKNSLLRTVNDDCEEPVNINTDKADDPNTLKKGLLPKPNDNTLLNKVRDAVKLSIDSQLSPIEKKKYVISSNPLETASSSIERLTDRPKTSLLFEKLSRSMKKQSETPISENIDMPQAASETLPSSMCMIGQTATDDINYSCRLTCAKE